MNNTADAPIFQETVERLGFDPGAFEKMPDLACIKCEKLDHELDHNAMCPQCVENARFDGGHRE